MGHYIKVPPRSSFVAQSVAALLSGILQVGVKQALFTSVKDICTEGQRSMLTCPHTRVFFSVSAIWYVWSAPSLLEVRQGLMITVGRGLIGPTRQFGTGTVYHGHLWALLVGAFLPVPFWWLQRRFPRTHIKDINILVFLNGPTYSPPATGINYSSWFLVGFIFREYHPHHLSWVRELIGRTEYLLRKRNFRWWSKFNYVLSSALDSGTAVSLLFIFLTLQLPKGNTIFSSLDWWGNTAPFKSMCLQMLFFA